MRLSSTWRIRRLKKIAPLERYLTTISPVAFAATTQPKLWHLCHGKIMPNIAILIGKMYENVTFTNGFLLWVSDFCNQWIWEFRGFNCGFSKKHFRPAFHCCFWGLLWTTCQPLQPSCHGVNQHLFLNLRSQHRSFWMVFLRRATGEVVKHRAVNYRKTLRKCFRKRSFMGLKVIKHGGFKMFYWEPHRRIAGRFKLGLISRG